MPATILTAEDVKRLLDACRDNVPGIRNKAVISVFYRTGMRTTELRHLRPEDIDFRYNAVRVIYARNRRARTVGIDDTALSFVSDWIHVWNEQKYPIGAPLFCSRTGRVITRSGIAEMLKRTANRAGIDKRMHTHAFRHTLAYDLSLEGVPLVFIRAQLGHLWATSTERYLSHLAPVEAIEVMKNRTWDIAGTISPDQIQWDPTETTTSASWSEWSLSQTEVSGTDHHLKISHSPQSSESGP